MATNVTELTIEDCCIPLSKIKAVMMHFEPKCGCSIELTSEQTNGIFHILWESVNELEQIIDKEISLMYEDDEPQDGYDLDMGDRFGEMLSELPDNPDSDGIKIQ